MELEYKVLIFSLLFNFFVLVVVPVVLRKINTISIDVDKKTILYDESYEPPYFLSLLMCTICLSSIFILFNLLLNSDISIFFIIACIVAISLFMFTYKIYIARIYDVITRVFVITNNHVYIRSLLVGDYRSIFFRIKSYHTAVSIKDIEGIQYSMLSRYFLGNSLTITTKTEQIKLCSVDIPKKPCEILRSIRGGLDV